MRWSRLEKVNLCGGEISTLPYNSTILAFSIQDLGRFYLQPIKIDHHLLRQDEPVCTHFNWSTAIYLGLSAQVLDCASFLEHSTILQCLAIWHHTSLLVLADLQIVNDYIRYDGTICGIL